MKTFYKRVNIFLNSLLFLFVIGAILFSLYTGTHGGLGNGNTLGGIVSAVLTILFVSIFILGFIFLVIGVIFGFYGKKKKDKESTSLAKRMIIKGIVECIISLALFFITSLALSFFGLQLESTHIPLLGDPNSPETGFPIKDLKIVGKVTDSNDSTSCDITVLNTNSKLSAANISVMVDGTENDYNFEQDHIAPGKTDYTTVSGNTKNPCNSVTIHDAGIARK